MELPTSLGERDLRDRKVDVLRAVHVPAPDAMAAHIRRARYTAGRTEAGDVPAYIEEQGVDPACCAEPCADVTLWVRICSSRSPSCDAASDSGR